MKCENEKLKEVNTKLLNALENLLNSELKGTIRDYSDAKSKAREALTEARGEIFDASTEHVELCERCNSQMVLDGSYVCECGHKQSAF